MKIKEITVGASRTINLGNYESLKVEGSCTVEVDDESELEQARANAVKEVKVQMAKMYKLAKPSKK